jgi:hypothetical protein
MQIGKARRPVVWLNGFGGKRSLCAEYPAQSDMRFIKVSLVTPAKAGRSDLDDWIPAFAALSRE